MTPFVLPASCTLFILLRFLFHHDLIINLWILVFVIDAIIIGLGLLSIVQLIITIRKKHNRFAGICLGVLLTISSISYGTDFIKELGLKLRFYRLKSAYSEIVENVKSEPGPQKGNHLGIDYRSEIDPVFRVTFPWAGIVDNWYGIIYDPSGKVLRCNESDPRFPGPGPKAPEDKELSQIRMVFGGLLYKAERLGNHWYLCWFT
jgi:hypothetical protein